MNHSPSISLRNSQRAVRINAADLEEFSRRALARVLAVPARPGAVLKDLPHVTVILVSDRKIAEIHRRFMNLPGATDVITFLEGDILVSVETAERHAREFQNSLGQEIRLYIVHGLLHLHGFEDTTRVKARAMTATQTRILSALAPD